jgi:hypothetical protein
MKNIVFLLICILLLSFNTDNSKKDLISKSLIGKWVYEPDDDNNSFRYIKSIELTKNTRGFIFHQSGKVTIYEEFGCQMPPNFWSREVNWKVKSSGMVIIEDYFNRKTKRMKIIEIDSSTLRFKWKKEKSLLRQ